MIDRRAASCLVALAVAVPPSRAAGQSVEAMMERGRAITRGCPVEPADAIVVCGRTAPRSRYRLSLPVERESVPRPPSGGLAAAEVLRMPGDCGPSGSRRCTRREALSQGYGGGRDPLTLAARLGGRLLDPDD